MTWQCHVCQQTFDAWAPAERHSRETGHVRIEMVFPAPERRL